MKIDRHHPFCATIKERTTLTSPSSTKQTFHLILDTTGANLEFKVGDAVVIYADNDPRLVQHIIDALKARGDEPIEDKRSHTFYTLRQFLTKKANLSRITSSFLKLLHTYEVSDQKKQALEELLLPENKPSLSTYLTANDPLDLFKEYEGNLAPLQEICNQFGPLLPRFYSIASSPKLYPNEIHLTVALFTLSHHNEIRYGVASHFLCFLATPQITPIPLYIQPSPHFSLPQDPNTPIILIGPGTGIAPFRAFLQERIHTNAAGANWLFFGERNREHDFFYQEELEHYQRLGKLHLDLAFSRDQPEKIYVQDLMLKKGALLWEWIKSGAVLYVCGDAENMAKGVDSALHSIIEKHGCLSLEETATYIKQLRKEHRYLTDVY